HDLSHLGFLAGQIGRLITISTTPVIAGDSFEMDAVGALRLSPLRRGLAIDSTVDIFTFYVPHRHVYGEQWIKFMKDGRSEERRVGKVCNSRVSSYIVITIHNNIYVFFFKQKTAYEIGLGIPAEPLFRSLRLSLATPSRWTPLALSVFLHCVVALLLTLL